MAGGKGNCTRIPWMSGARFRLVDQIQQLCLSCRCWQLVQRALHSDPLTSSALVSHVDFARRVLTDQYGGQVWLHLGKPCENEPRLRQSPPAAPQQFVCHQVLVRSPGLLLAIRTITSARRRPTKLFYRHDQYDQQNCTDISWPARWPLWQTRRKERAKAPHGLGRRRALEILGVTVLTKSRRA